MSPVFVSPVVSTQWVADHLGSASLLLIDASVRLVAEGSGEMQFQGDFEAYRTEGHIPGAVFADLPADFALDGTDFHHPSDQALAEAIRRTGICDHSRIVIYDRSHGQWATRLWWLLRTAGVAEAAIIDGGLHAWRTEHRSLEIGEVPPTPSSFETTPRTELWAQSADVTSALNGTSPAAILSGLAPTSVTEVGEEISRARRVVNLRPEDLTDRHDRTLLSDARLRELYRPVLAGSLPIICVGDGAVSASANALGLAVLGIQNIRVFDTPISELLAS